jgi:hypothetical protein
MKSHRHVLTPKLAVGSLLIVSALAGCQVARRGGALEGHAADEWTRSYPLAPDGEVQIVGASGSVDVQGGSGSTVEVRAERIARASSDAAARELLPRIEIREDITPEKIVLQTQGLAGIVIGVEIQVNYHVTMPASGRVRVRAVNGAVTIADMTGGIIASSTNGEVIGKNLSGGVDARSVNKPVTIDLAAFGRDPVELRAVNGAVNLALPATVNASFEANCTNGTIDIKDLTLEPFGEQTRRRVRGRLNAGGPPIEVTTVNGDIRVRAR